MSLLVILTKEVYVMAQTSALKALADYFNKDENGKNIKPLREFSDELKELTPEEKAELAALAAEAMGQTL